MRRYRARRGFRRHRRGFRRIRRYSIGLGGVRF